MDGVGWGGVWWLLWGYVDGEGRAFAQGEVLVLELDTVGQCRCRSLLPKRRLHPDLSFCHPP